VTVSTARPPFSLLSVAANIERHRLSSGEPFLLLLMIQFPGSADPTATQQYLRLVRNTDPVTFDAGDGQGAQVYTPFNFELGEIKMSANSSVPTLDLKASNVMRALQSTIEQYSGLVGAIASLMVVNTANPAGEAELAMNFTVTQAICDPQQVTLKLGASSPMRRLFPLFMYRPNYCMWQYKGPQCAYSGSMATCTHTIDGAAGCQAHNNVLRFGGFPGIDSSGASAAGVV
jgi:phage-related protein